MVYAKELCRSGRKLTVSEVEIRAMFKALIATSNTVVFRPHSKIPLKLTLSLFATTLYEAFDLLRFVQQCDLAIRV